MLLGIQFLHSILKTRELKTFSKINPEYFIDSREREAFFAVTDYLSKYGDLPPVNFLSQYIDPIVDEDIDYHPQYLADQLKDRYLKARLNELATMITNNYPVDSIMPRITGLITISAELNQGILDAPQFQEILREAIARNREFYLRTGLTGYPTGWPTLDRVTGGYQKGDIYIFSGRPKKGKTMYMLWSLNTLLLNYKCLFISMEMTAIQILARLCGIRARISPALIRRGDITTEIEELILTTANIPNLYLHVPDMKKRNYSSIVSSIVATKPDVVFIDGAYLIKSERKRERIFEEVKDVIEHLKGIAITFDIPIICSYQLNRASASRKEDLDLTHLALSDALGQTASAVIGIIETEVPTQRRFEVIANRDGETDDFFTNWNWDYSDFSEIMF